ncbi:efflux RND transporter periplasmic adaptor subunit [Colwellia psychrerythraea]|uniref:Efflux transporter, RND family, MFP subunit n=1 Tax=Colwellia psychrerythraea TaxID=28229 RepID=A0A099KIZ6_COLPS|nr:efflux RND transporter periplasmic adaptor subunit [Colwellia psychrerythraea]KGJ89548.1 efflux transporter, RND family, MFP subunit [Colwellia psychrerythraea]
MKFLSVKYAGIALFIGLAVVSTTALSYKGSTVEKTPAVEQPIILKTDHDHDAESENVLDKSGHEHGADDSTDDHATEEKSDDGHDHGGESASESTTAEDHEEGISFSPEKMALAHIKVTNLKPTIFAKSVYAPGEIKANGYTSYIVSPRTESVVISRHAILGEHVSKGQALVTLFSESMAAAQAEYRVAYSDWQRTKKLGLGTVSESRLLASETDYISAYGRLTAFGLTKAAIQNIVKNNSSNLGEYTLVAQRSGVVLSDDFSQGQRVPAGEKVMVLADEKDLWVEARVSPNKKLSLPIGTSAKVEFAGQVHEAKVIQEAHTIDPSTRTRIVRLSVENTDDSLHSGMFVNVNFQFDTQGPVIAVPETALMRGADGDWTVFVEDHPGEFKAVEVELGQPLGDYRQIIGIEPDTRVVTKGAFFVASEIAKGGFDPHGH